MMKQKTESYNEAETAKRRDEVIRRMANTPPQPKANHRPKKRRTTAVDRAVRKDRVRREA